MQIPNLHSTRWLPECDRAMSRVLRLEIAEARPAEVLAQIDFRHDHGAPLLGLSQHASFAVVHGGEHPLLRNIGVTAAHQKHVVLTSPRRGQQWVTARYRESDDLRPTRA